MDLRRESERRRDPKIPRLHVHLCREQVRQNQIPLTARPSFGRWWRVLSSLTLGVVLQEESEVRLLVSCCQETQHTADLCTSSGYSRYGISRTAWKHLSHQLFEELGRASAQAFGISRQEWPTLLATCNQSVQIQNARSRLDLPGCSLWNFVMS